MRYYLTHLTFLRDFNNNNIKKIIIMFTFHKITAVCREWKDHSVSK